MFPSVFQHREKKKKQAEVPSGFHEGAEACQLSQ